MQETSVSRKEYTEKYLMYVRSLPARITAIQDQIETKRSLLDLTAIQYKENVTQTTTDGAMAECISDLKSLIADYCIELREYIEHQRQAFDAFMKLSRAEYIKAMTDYYLKGYTWEEVCVDLGYSWDGMMKLRRKAIEEVYEVMPDKWKRGDTPVNF